MAFNAGRQICTAEDASQARGARGARIDLAGPAGRSDPWSRD
jgi:hypothetical protein